MNNLFGSNPKLKIYPREKELKTKWEGKNETVTVNESQFSLLKSENEEKEFKKKQFSNPEDLKKYNHYREEWYRRAKEFDHGNAPLAVTIELVSTCNLGCTMCYTITEEFQSSVVGSTRMLPWPVVKNIIDECCEIGVYSILFSWRGESSLYRYKNEDGSITTFTDVLSYAVKKGILEVTSLTHGQNFSDEFCENLVKAQPNWISFSIDGLGEDYNKIRTPRNKKKDKSYDAFEKVINTIRKINYYKNELNLVRPQIRTNAIFPSISRNVEEYKNFMYENGVSWCTVNEILDFRSDDLNDDEIKKDWACQYPFQRLTVAANGVLLPCTGAHNEEKELNLGQYMDTEAKKIKLGKDLVNTKPEFFNIKDVWESKKINYIRQKHKAGERKDLKKGCRNCRHGAKKQGADYVPIDWDFETMDWKGHDFKHG
jgi:MoaA/NifB/PqqE/SkfB family radical SAM enzyme